MGKRISEDEQASSLGGRDKTVTRQTRRQFRRRDYLSVL